MPALTMDGRHALAPAPKGSLHRMHLGSQTLDQLATLVNWSNVANHSATAVEPWVGIEDVTISSDSASSVMDGPSEDVHSVPVIAETISQTTQPPVSMPLVADPSDDAEDSEASVSVEATVPSLDSPEAHSTVGSAYSEPPKEDSLEQLSGDRQRVSETTDAGEMESRETVEMTQNTSDHASSPHLTIAVNEAPARSVPIMRGSPRPMRMDAMIPKSTVPTRDVAVGDSNYLQRLESLVLELNLQLARVTSPMESEADTMQWMSQRVIDLSLQNLALQEQLAKHQSK